MSLAGIASFLQRIDSPAKELTTLQLRGQIHFHKSSVKLVGWNAAVTSMHQRLWKFWIQLSSLFLVTKSLPKTLTYNNVMSICSDPL